MEAGYAVLKEQELRTVEHHSDEVIEHKDEVIERNSDDFADLKTQIDRLKDDNVRLSNELARLQQQQSLVNPEPVEGHYTLDQFMTALARHRGRTYGWRKDYAEATEQTPDSFKVSTDDIQRWQKEKRVPQQAYVQIDWLMFPDRVGRSQPKPNWSQADIAYLIEQYEADPNQANALLGQKCSEHFGRPISEQAIKGALFRQAEAGRVPKQRPTRR